MTESREPIVKSLATAAIYATGALAYYLTVAQFGANFAVTPLFFGAVMLVASVFRPRLIASALLLGAWGAAVLLLQHGALPRERNSAVYMIAFGAAALLSLLARRWIDPAVALESAAVVLLVGGLSLYGSFDVDRLGRGSFWALALFLNAVGLAATALWRDRARKLAAARGRAAVRSVAP